jgi:hypothetical protein
MNKIILMASALSKSFSAFLGIIVISIFMSVIISGVSFNDFAGQTLNLFGGSFIIFLSLFIFMVTFCWVKMLEYRFDHAERDVWTQLGHHIANGTATLALTYTLLGISLGIGSLSNQELNADTIQTVIRGLTQNFSLAFMTTVVGLPVSGILRAILSVTEARIIASQGNAKINKEYHFEREVA